MMIPIAAFEPYHIDYINKDDDHPLRARANDLYTALSSIKEGEPYIDITLESLEGKAIELSQIMDKNKYTLLDLWSPWCRPCISKSKLIEANYARIQDKLQVISVVGGIKNVESARNAINKYQYPWSSYVEVLDKHSIWLKYGMRNAGGAQVLINTDGRILAINPSIDAILDVLQK